MFDLGWIFDDGLVLLIALPFVLVVFVCCYYFLGCDVWLLLIDCLFVICLSLFGFIIVLMISGVLLLFSGLVDKWCCFVCLALLELLF